MRRAARTDANHGAVAQALAAYGASVVSLASVGRGIPDLLVGWRGRNFLIEVKDGEKPPSKRQLTGDQKEFHTVWRGEVHVVYSVASALALLRENGTPRRK